MATKFTPNQRRYQREVERVGLTKMRQQWKERKRLQRVNPEALTVQANRQLEDLASTKGKLETALSGRVVPTR